MSGAIRSKAVGLWKPSDECRLTGLQNPSMYLATAFSVYWWDCQSTSQTRSDLRVLKNISIIAFS